MPAIEHSQLPRLHHRKRCLEEDLEGLGSDPSDVSFNYLPYRVDSDFERAAILQMLKEAGVRSFELYYNGMTNSNLASFRIRTPLGIYTPDFLPLKRQGGQRYKTQTDGATDRKAREIEAILIIETKGKLYYDAAFKAKERFIKDYFLPRNPHCRYCCIVAENSRNDFQTALDRLRKEIGKWARAKSTKR